MWTSRVEDRLREWKIFRGQITECVFDEAVKKTVNLWSYAPFVDHYLDHSEPGSWPDPWELLSTNVYDDMAKALGMVYTLHLSGHGKNHEFSIMRAGCALEQYNIVMIDQGQYIINYAFNEVINNQQLDKELTIFKIYTASDLQLSKF